MMGKALNLSIDFFYYDGNLRPKPHVSGSFDPTKGSTGGAEPSPARIPCRCR